MNEMILVIYGAVFGFGLACGMRIWKNSRYQIKRQAALDLLKHHGLTARLYLPTVGITDPSLSDALEELGSKGYIIIDAKGNIVGCLDISKPKSQKLRLVVSNDLPHQPIKPQK